MFNKYADLTIYLKNGETVEYSWSDYSECELQGGCLVVKDGDETVGIFNMDSVLKVIRE